MTGGLGFTRQGTDSYKSNRGLIGKRKSMGNIPGYGQSNKEPLGEKNLEELKEWKDKRDAKQKRLRLIIYSVIGVSVLLVILYNIFFQ